MPSLLLELQIRWPIHQHLLRLVAGVLYLRNFSSLNTPDDWSNKLKAWNDSKLELLQGLHDKTDLHDQSNTQRKTVERWRECIKDTIRVNIKSYQNSDLLSNLDWFTCQLYRLFIWAFCRLQSRILVIIVMNYCQDLIWLSKAPHTDWSRGSRIIITALVSGKRGSDLSAFSVSMSSTL